jgi:hypothetical protein
MCRGKNIKIPWPLDDAASAASVNAAKPATSPWLLWSPDDNGPILGAWSDVDMAGARSDALRQLSAHVTLAAAGGSSAGNAGALEFLAHPWATLKKALPHFTHLVASPHQDIPRLPGLCVYPRKQCRPGTECHCAPGCALSISATPL